MNRVLVFVVLLVAAGCQRNSTDPVVGPKKAETTADDKTQIALDMFRQGSTLPQYRDALNLLGAALSRPENQARLALTSEQRAVFEKDAQLSATEIGEIEAVQFRPIDAIYIDGCALFRDAARSVEIPGLTELDQAAFAFDWVGRHVLLYQQAPADLPPAYVLRAGYGGPTDRGLVFLSLVHQLKMEGCLLASADTGEAPLAGLLIQKKLYLFDNRLGLPIPGPGGKGIASWDDVREQPELLKISKLSVDDAKALNAYIAMPLESLSPRMKFLDALLQGEESNIGGDRLAVAHDASQVKAALIAAGAPNVRFWQPALRAVRRFTPADEGGTDKSHRAAEFALKQSPFMLVAQRYQELKILDELPKPGQVILIEQITKKLFDLYDVQPGEMLIRGKFEALPRRLERIRSAVDDTEFATSSDDRELVPVVARWRERMKAAYGALVRNEADGPARVNALWSEDQYLGYLMLDDLETMPRGVQKKDLSKIVLSAAREPLSARANWLFASLSQDKAERLGASRLSQKGNKVVAANIRNAWLNARSAWTKYLDRNNVGPTIFTSTLPEMRRALPRGLTELALQRWEAAHREFHQYVAAKLELARAMDETGQNSAAMLDQVAKELNDLLQDDALAKERAAIGAVFQTPDAQRRWSLINRDWGDGGYFAWALDSVRLAKK